MGYSLWVWPRLLLPLSNKQFTILIRNKAKLIKEFLIVTNVKAQLHRTLPYFALKGTEKAASAKAYNHSKSQQNPTQFNL